ncbi:MAG: hypothetical protein OSB05_04795 [Akkermansiaceae bacterium]|nr:hypothetical protein [Akkermansiaceae bacterium]
MTLLFLNFEEKLRFVFPVGFGDVKKFAYGVTSVNLDGIFNAAVGSVLQEGQRTDHISVCGGKSEASNDGDGMTFYNSNDDSGRGALFRKKGDRIRDWTPAQVRVG